MALDKPWGRLSEGVNRGGTKNSKNDRKSRERGTRAQEIKLIKGAGNARF